MYLEAEGSELRRVLPGKLSPDLTVPGSPEEGEDLR